MDKNRILFCWLALSSACVLPEVGEDSSGTATEANQPATAAAANPSPSDASATKAQSTTQQTAAMTPSGSGGSQAPATDAMSANNAAQNTSGPASAAPSTPPSAMGMSTAAMSGGAGSGAAAGSSAAAGSGGPKTTPPSGSAGRPAAMMPTAAGRCGPTNANAPAMLDQPGPWTTTHVDKTGPKGASWIYFPADLGKDGFKHPVFNWGPGAGNTPEQYADHLNLLASQGFVIISQASTDSGKEALNWILAENDKPGSMWSGKLDTTRVGRGGHSMGALQTCSEADDPRLTLYVLVCGGGNGTGGAVNIHAPSIFLGGEGEGGTANFEGDYAAIQTAPSVFVTKTDTDHIYCARNNLAPWVAFMRLTWCGDEQYRADLKDGGTFCKSPWLNCKSKNAF